jgi:hypothetical protein
MKIRGLFYIVAAFGFMLTGCEEDNFEPPKSTLTGQVVYQDQAIGVRSNGVQLELWQPGFALFEKIPVHVDQDGSFSAALFDGNYKLVRLRGNGPWVDNTDTINVEVKGATVVDVPVQPYYMIRNEQYLGNGESMTATLDVEQVTPGTAIERVTFYIGTTTIVDANNFAAVTDIWEPTEEALSAPMSLTIALPGELAAREYAFARVGIKMAGVQEMIYSQVHKVSFN